MNQLKGKKTDSQPSKLEKKKRPMRMKMKGSMSLRKLTKLPLYFHGKRQKLKKRVTKKDTTRSKAT